MQIGPQPRPGREETGKGRFAGKTVLITGAASGIGKATATAFAREGAKVVIADVNERSGEQLVREIENTGGQSIFVTADVSKAADVRRLVETAVQRFGRLDIAVNNAGIEGLQAPTAQVREEDFDHLVSIDLKGVYLGLRFEIAEMLKNGRGAIVNVSSVAGLVGFENAAPYVAAKHGVVGLTKTAALEYAKQGIRINAVAPGVIRTPMVERSAPNAASMEQFTSMEPVGRLGEPEEVADAILFLASDAASFITGTVLEVDGGFMAR
ncbi:MAG: SDR family NAD(P)-dependent oxidoreductase [Chloroflexota bacterium]